MKNICAILFLMFFCVSAHGQADSSCDFGAVDHNLGTIGFQYNISAADFEDLTSAFFAQVGAELDLRHQQNSEQHPRLSGYIHVRVVVAAGWSHHIYDVCFQYDNSNSYEQQLTGEIQGQGDSSQNSGDNSNNDGPSVGGGDSSGGSTGGQAIGSSGGTGSGGGGGGGGCASSTVVGTTNEVVVICHTH